MKTTHTIRVVGAVGLVFVVPSLLSAQRLLPVGSGIQGLGVYDMIEYDGELVIGGFYTRFNDHLRRNLQAWDGTQHNDLPGAFEAGPSRVLALEVFEGDLIAAGRDNGAGLVTRWDGSSWTNMGASFTGNVEALTVFDGELYAAGQDSAVSRWDGAQWEVVGVRFNAAVLALEVHDGSLHAAGAFTAEITGTTDLRRLAQWNGSAWTEVGVGLGGTVRDLLSTAGGLVIAGDFTTDGDGAGSYPHWAIHDGSNLLSPGFPDNGEVDRIAAHPQEGFILGASIGNGTRWVVGGQQREVPITVRAAVEFQGRVLVAGVGSTLSYVPVLSIGELAEGLSAADLDVNHIAAHFAPNTALFSDYASGNGRPGFEVPKGEGTHTFYSFSPWLTGTQDGMLHSAAPQYVNAGAPTDGPHADVMDADFHRRYYQVWRFDREELQAHADHWDEPGYVVPYGIASWPGNGDASNGEPEQLAPYADMNMNGVYEPQLGDHPLMRGDRMVYQILHSVIDADSLRPVMIVDIHAMHYAYGDATNDDLWNTTFTNFKIIDRSGLGYEDVRFGAFADLDIGGGADDFIGCDSTLSIAYGYNGDDTDDPAFGALGYGTSPPAQGILFLNHPMSAHRSYPGDGFPVPLSDLMNGTTFGAPFTEPGYPTHFQFPGGSWSEASALSMPGDRRSVASCGPFTLAAGDTLCIDLAFPFAREVSSGPLWNVQELLQRGAGIRAFYNNSEVDCASTPNIITRLHEEEVRPLRAYPNPTADRLILFGIPEEGLHRFDVFDMTGQLVHTMQATVSSGQCTLRMNDLSNGVYQLVWRSRTGRTGSVRAIVGH